MNQSLTSPRIANGLQLNHSFTTPRIASGFVVNHSLTAPRVARGISIGLVVAGLSLAPAALADAPASHGSCGDGARAFTLPLAQDGQVDDIVVPLATTGQAADTVAGLHATYCEPRP